MIRDYILPLGSIIRLKKGDQDLMIVGRAQLYNNEGTIGYLDYAAVLHPAGIQSSTGFIFFNDEDIAEVIFEGLRNEPEKEFAASYEENVSKTNYQKIHIE